MCYKKVVSLLNKKSSSIFACSAEHMKFRQPYK
jgi:hypothetical protein